MDTEDKILLSIIIPYYNVEKYCLELLEKLDKQVSSEVQVILVDDGSAEPFKCDYDWLEIYHKVNGGASSARNYGIEKALGKYISFIDADDLVPEYYIDTLLKKIKTENFDYCYLSWKTLPTGWQCDVKLNTIEDKFPSFNLCCWNRVYSREMIGDIRFNENKAIAEDAEFIRDVREEGKLKSFISDYMYFYRSDTPDSLTKRFAKGEIYTKRFVFNYQIINANMTDLLTQVKEYNKIGEVIVMTNQNYIPELEKYAMVTKPIPIKGTELIGEPTKLFSRIKLPLKTQVVIYTAKTFAIGGIETFIYNFCMNLKEYYDITVLYDEMDREQIKRLRPYVRVCKNRADQIIVCDTLIMNRISDSIPNNVKFNKKLQMLHACKIFDYWHVPTDNDCIVAVSDTARKTFADEIGNHSCEVINNLTYNTEVKPALKLISATRFTVEKGEERIYKLAELLKANNIPFTWTIFTEDKMRKSIPEIQLMPPTLNIRAYIASADYLVQLSDSEGFCYSLVEALELGTPVITTPIDVLREIGVVDGENAWIVPFNMENINVNRINNIRLKFDYKNNNEKLISQWSNLLGATTPSHDYQYKKDSLKLMAKVQYKDIQIGRTISVGEIYSVPEERALQIEKAGFAEIIE